MGPLLGQEEDTVLSFSSPTMPPQTSCLKGNGLQETLQVSWATIRKGFCSTKSPEMWRVLHAGPPCVEQKGGLPMWFWNNAGVSAVLCTCFLAFAMTEARKTAKGQRFNALFCFSGSPVDKLGSSVHQELKADILPPCEGSYSLEERPEGGREEVDLTVMTSQG